MRWATCRLFSADPRPTICEFPPAIRQPSAAVSAGLTQVEALDANDNYAPDIASSLFSSKNFTIKSGVSGISGHANKVGTNFFATGNQLPGSSGVDIYSASDWLNSAFLNRGSTSLPASESRAVQNHSWISTASPDEDAAEPNQRLDYAIQSQGFICVVGQNNDATNPLPQLLGQGYHSISVGRSDGQQSAGFTTLDGTGRTQAVPGVLVRSVFPDSTGQPLFLPGSFLIDQGSPLRERWGGYYVTGYSSLPHLGNRTFKHRCSYMVYSAAFNSLPARIRSAVIGQLHGILNSDYSPQNHPDLKSASRRRISSILEETLAGWPQ